MKRNHHRLAFSLIELIAALVIASTIAAASLYYLRTPGVDTKQRTCDLAREMLQNDVQRYFEFTGVMPNANLDELLVPQFSGPLLPTCPVTDQPYTLDRAGVVACPTHEDTRVK